MKLILLIAGLLLKILTAQSQPQWLNHNGFWYMFVGHRPPPGAQPPIAAPFQQRQNSAAHGLISHRNPPAYNANRGPAIVKSLSASRPAPQVPIPLPPAPTQPSPRAQPPYPTFQRQHAPPLLRHNAIFGTHRYPAFPSAINFAGPLQPPVQQRATATPPAQPLEPRPHPQSAIRSWGPVPIWNPIAQTPGYQNQAANYAHARHGFGHGQQPNIYQQPFHRGPTHSMYQGGVRSPFVPLEGPDVDLGIIPCGDSARKVTTPTLPGMSPPEYRCVCEDRQDCDMVDPRKPPDLLCPLWATCCCRQMPATSAPPSLSATPAVR